MAHAKGAVGDRCSNLQQTRNPKGGGCFSKFFDFFKNKFFKSKFVARGANINVVGKDGGTPLDCAAMFGRLDILKWLLSVGAISWMVRFQGQAPLHAAAMFGHRPIVEWLLQHGDTANLRGLSGMTALHFTSLLDAEKRSQLNAYWPKLMLGVVKPPPSFAELYDPSGVVEALLAAGADSNLAGESTFTFGAFLEYCFLH